MTPSWFALVVLIAGVFATAPGVIALQLFFCLFGATAAFELTALGGAPVLPAVAFLPFLLRRAWPERLHPDALRMPPAAVWLLLTVAWAVVSALVVPRLLSGTVAVKTYDRTGRDDAITVLLRPVSGNITQSAYAVLDLLVFFSMRVLLAKEGRMVTFARGVLLLAAANCFAALVGLAEYYAGLPRILEAIRSAKYTVFETYELGGIARVQGTFSEAAVFSMFTLPLFAFTSSLWLSRAFTPYAGYLALGSLVLLLISTSGTAYVGLSVYLGLLAVGMAWRLLTKGTIPRLESLFVGGAVAAVALCAVLVSSPEIATRIASFVDATVLRKLSSSSGLDRSAANALAWTDFLGTYGLGVGLGSTRASSFAMVLLSNLGVLGGLTFVVFLVHVVRAPAADGSLDSIVARSARQAVIASLIAACVVGTVFDLGIAFYCFAATATMAHAAPVSKPGPGGQRVPVASTPLAGELLFGDTVGLHVKFAEGQPESDLASLDELGVRWARDSVPWHKLEPHPGDFRPFPPEFERRLAFYREHDIGLVFILAFANEAAYPATENEPLRAIDPSHFAGYAVEVAKRLKRAGVRFVLEIWNEPHHFTVRQLAGGAWNGAPPSPWVQHYVRMVTEVTRRIKQFDPSIPLLDDDDMWVLHYRFMEAGLPAKLDGFAVHPYTRHQPSANVESWFPPEHAAIGSNTPWVLPFVAVDDDASFESAVRRLRDTGAHGRSSAPAIWITEWGFKFGDQSSDGPLTEDLVAAYLPRAYILSANAGVRALCWFSSADRNDGPWGLTANDGRRRKPYYALRALTRELAAFSFVGRVAGAKRRTAGAQAFLFCRQGVTCTVVAWNIDNPQGRIRLAGPLAPASADDVFGVPLVPRADVNGVPVLPLGKAPIYLRGLPGRMTASGELVASVEASLQ